MSASANHIAKTQFPLITLGGQLNALEALVDSIIRAGYLDTLTPDEDSIENVNTLLGLCRREVRQAVELSRLCEEHYAGQNHERGSGG